MWTDTGTGSFTEQKIYVVQTGTKIVERCVLMTTDPGDIVLDPTCGSGTTAVVAEQWGRRWIMVDTSRVALSLARQRVLTSKFDLYRTRDPANQDPSTGFVVRTVAHITLKSIAQNVRLDEIFERHSSELARLLDVVNEQIAQVPARTRAKLQAKLADKERSSGKNSVTDDDRRRWDLSTGPWKEWEVPFAPDSDWPDGLRNAVDAYRAEWRRQRAEVEAAIAASADQEELVDQPEVVKNISPWKEFTLRN
jgi:adenine-specific DNA-methyltransferase